jgi:hypothetical protein
MKRIAVFAAVAALCAFGGMQAQAAVLQIGYTGVDLTYDGSSLFDTESIIGGGGDPAEAQPLLTMTFDIQGSGPPALLTLLAPDIWHDLFLDLGPIPAPAVGTSVTVIGSGINDLLMVAAGIPVGIPQWGLAVDVTMEVTVTNLGAAGIFVTAVGAGTIFFQDLPDGIPDFDPLSLIEVSFSTQVVDGTYTEAGGFITGFETTGTGEHSGNTQVIPEPASCVLLGIGLVMGGVAWRRRKAA